MKEQSWSLQESISLDSLIDLGLVKIGEGTIIEANVELCHSTRNGEQKLVTIGRGCHIRSGTIIYSGVEFGDDSQTGHHVVIRENTKIGNHSIVGTGVKVEMDTIVGDHVLIETQSHITGKMIIEDYVYVGGFVGTTNDKHMLWQREGAGQFLRGPTLRRGCRIGSGAILLPGVVIGRDVIIGAGAVVTRDIPDGRVALGVPARVVGDVVDDKPVMFRGYTPCIRAWRE